METEQGLILIYHRVADLKSDPFQLAVHPENFKSHMEFLRYNFSVIPLAQMTDRLNAGKTIANHISITFDDGYADNYHQAKPILEAYNIPATVFITVDMIGSKCEFWWDELERICSTQKKLLRIPELKRVLPILSWPTGNPKPTIEAFHEIHQFLKQQPGKKRERIIKNLFRRAGLIRHGREGYRALDKTQIKDMSLSHLIEIGSHGMSHSSLPTESIRKQWAEIYKSKKILEKICQKEIRFFSYPFGQRKDINDYIIECVRNAGYRYGISNIQGNISGEAHPFIIPRRLIKNWNQENFQDALKKFLPFRTTSPNSKVNKSDKEGKRDIFINHYLRNLATTQYGKSHNPKRATIKNILIMNRQDRKGGAAKIGHGLFRQLHHKGYNTHLLVQKKSSSPDDKEISIILPEKKTEQTYLLNFQRESGWLDVFHYSSFKIKNRKIFKDADIVHLHNLHKWYFSIMALPEICHLKPVIWTLHDMFAITGHCNQSFECEKWEYGCGQCPNLQIESKIQKDATHFLWRLKKTIYKQSDFVIVTPSRWLKNQLGKSILKEKYIEHIPNGVDETVFINHPKHLSRKKLNLPIDKNILLYISHGGLKQYLKGGHLIEEISGKLNIRDTLVISIGNPISDSQNTRTLPYIEDEKVLSLYYSAADLMIYPTLADNFPLVVLESLSCGTPVISFDTGGIPEIITHQKTGYIGKYKKISDLVQGIAFFLRDPVLLHRAGIEARQSVMKKFTQEKMISEYLKIYHHVWDNFSRKKKFSSNTLKRNISQLIENQISIESRYRASSKNGN